MCWLRVLNGVAPRTSSTRRCVRSKSRTGAPALRLVLAEMVGYRVLSKGQGAHLQHEAVRALKVQDGAPAHPAVLLRHRLQVVARVVQGCRSRSQPALPRPRDAIGLTPVTVTYWWVKHNLLLFLFLFGLLLNLNYLVNAELVKTLSAQVSSNRVNLPQRSTARPAPARNQCPA